MHTWILLHSFRLGKKQGGTSKQLNNALKLLSEILLAQNISLELCYVPSSLNEADSLSRVLSDKDCKLAGEPWRTVENLFGPHTMDLMALDSNVQVGHSDSPLPHFSPFPTPDSIGVNVFTQVIAPHENTGEGIWKPAAPCPECGYLNDADYNFCQRCGFRNASSVSVPPSKRLKIDFKAIDNRLQQLAHVKSSKNYERQKSSLHSQLMNFLSSMPVPKNLASASPADIIKFLVWKDSLGKTVVLHLACPSLGKNRDTSCSCPTRLAAGTVDSIIVKL